MKPKIVLLIGNIGSGKSTTAKKYVKKGYLSASRDAFRYMLHADNYIFDRSLEQAIHRAHMATIEALLSTGRNIVVDEVNARPSGRKQTIKLAKKYDYSVYAHVLPAWSKQECLRRRKADPHGTFNKRDWLEVWEMFDDGMQPPDKTEGFTGIIKDNWNKQKLIG